ncbi:MAG: hypothetical protein E6K80_15210, partial [Candidatus Eisenbacteria bacterium]
MLPSAVRRLPLRRVLVLIAALAPRLAHAESASPSSGLGALPATFIGTLPCADCVGIRWQINLLDNGAYEQRAAYLRDGRDESVYEIGTWSLNDRTLTLNGGRERPDRWSVDNPNTLQKLGIDGQPIATGPPQALTRAPSLLPMEPRVRLRGLYRATAQGARFSDCVSGLQWPVAREADGRALEEAYSRQKKMKPGGDLMVTLDGRIETAPAAERGGDQERLVVERFLHASPGEICLEQPARTDLVQAHWELVRVGSQTVTASASHREPWIVLDPDGQSL